MSVFSFDSHGWQCQLGISERPSIYYVNHFLPLICSKAVGGTGQAQGEDVGKILQEQHSRGGRDCECDILLGLDRVP